MLSHPASVCQSLAANTALHSWGVWPMLTHNSTMQHAMSSHCQAATDPPAWSEQMSPVGSQAKSIIMSNRGLHVCLCPSTLVALRLVLSAHNTPASCPTSPTLVVTNLPQSRILPLKQLLVLAQAGPARGTPRGLLRLHGRRPGEGHGRKGCSSGAHADQGSEREAH